MLVSRNSANMAPFNSGARLDCKLDIHVALDLAMAVAVDKFLRRLGNHREAIVIEPIEQRTN